MAHDSCIVTISMAWYWLYPWLPRSNLWQNLQLKIYLVHLPLALGLNQPVGWLHLFGFTFCQNCQRVSGLTWPPPGQRCPPQAGTRRGGESQRRRKSGQMVGHSWCTGSPWNVQQMWAKMLPFLPHQPNHQKNFYQNCLHHDHVTKSNITSKTNLIS